jgi:hypothetical protein
VLRDGERGRARENRGRGCDIRKGTYSASPAHMRVVRPVETTVLSVDRNERASGHGQHTGKLITDLEGTE